MPANNQKKKIIQSNIVMPNDDPQRIASIERSKVYKHRKMAITIICLVARFFVYFKNMHK